MMQMLVAGGLPCLMDDLRSSDIDNPRGYFEYEKAKQLQSDSGWLPEARGKVVKIVAQLLAFLPTEYHYQVIFMQRDLDEVIASQRVMLDRSGSKGAGLSDERLKSVFRRQLEQAEKSLQERNIPSVEVRHQEVIQNPLLVAKQLKSSLKLELDEERMVSVVDQSLYRQRSHV